MVVLTKEVGRIIIQGAQMFLTNNNVRTNSEMVMYGTIIISVYAVFQQSSSISRFENNFQIGKQFPDRELFSYISIVQNQRLEGKADRDAISLGFQLHLVKLRQTIDGGILS